LKRIVFLRNLSLTALLSLLIFSCTKELSPIGIELVDPSELLSMGYSDTVSIVAYSLPEDSLYTSNLSYAQIGSMYDPIFGKTTASFYTQVFLSARVRFGPNPVFDSAYLYLPYRSSYGDTMSNMTLHVYALTESILDSVQTYSSSTVAYDQANPLGQFTFQPRPHDTTYSNGKKLYGMLRIPLNSNFGDAVMFPSDTSILNSNTKFVEYFKGITIMADEQNTKGSGAIITYSVPSDQSKIVMYYHSDEDTSAFTFSLSTGCARFQNYDHNGYAEAMPSLRQQLQGDTQLGQQSLFAQGLAGSKIKILFPYINKWINSSKIIINDAQLIFGNGSVSSNFLNPGYLYLRTAGAGGSTNPGDIIDYTEGTAYFDGTYNSSSNSYRFRITRYIQQLIKGEQENYGLHLIIPSAEYNASRLVLNGTSSPQSDVKLYLRYTKLP
jgi:hypothetical protein